MKFPHLSCGSDFFLKEKIKNIMLLLLNIELLMTRLFGTLVETSTVIGDCYNSFMQILLLNFCCQLLRSSFAIC